MYSMNACIWIGSLILLTVYFDHAMLFSVCFFFRFKSDHELDCTQGSNRMYTTKREMHNNNSAIINLYINQLFFSIRNFILLFYFSFEWIVRIFENRKPKYLFDKYCWYLLIFTFFFFFFFFFVWFVQFYIRCVITDTTLNFLCSARILLEMCYYWFKKIPVSVKIVTCMYTMYGVYTRYIYWNRQPRMFGITLFMYREIFHICNLCVHRKCISVCVQCAVCTMRNGRWKQQKKKKLDCTRTNETK